ncbi:hypothetical protein D5396_00045 [Rahnella inusitata]|uniref:Uncharacterized protein n=1 Tax=Rahnella inusitata TaxID=58169 RepID=A0ABX9P3I3_9GAMM|nr:hypothetical protein D5396_00045 [Rahnella inusitata]
MICLIRNIKIENRVFYNRNLSVTFIARQRINHYFGKYLRGNIFIHDTKFIKSNSSQIETTKKILYNIGHSALILTVMD